MESFLEKTFKFYYYCLHFPYTLTWEPGLQIHFSLRKSRKQYKLWIFACAILFCHLIATWSTLVHFLPNYFKNQEFDKLAFHSIWAICTISVIYQELPHLKLSKDVMQLVNGNIGLVKHLEKCKFN